MIDRHAACLADDVTPAKAGPMIDRHAACLAGDVTPAKAGACKVLALFVISSPPRGAVAWHTVTAHAACGTYATQRRIRIAALRHNACGTTAHVGHDARMPLYARKQPCSAYMVAHEGQPA